MSDKKPEKTIVIYHAVTGAPTTIPASHADNYIGKGYTRKKPTKKEA